MNKRHSAFLLADTISQFCYIDDLLFICDWASDEIMNNGDLLDSATMIVSKLSEFPECKKRMKQKKLFSHFKNKQKEGKNSI